MTELPNDRDLIVTSVTEENPTQIPVASAEFSPDDTVERLVSLATCGAFNRKEAGIMLRAADKIERLRDENVALKAELDRITPVLNHLLDGN
jgi:hypothetical protein